MIVADVNVVVYRYVKGPFSSLADAVHAKDPDWRVPQFWRCEFASAMLKMVRARSLTEVDARSAIDDAERHLVGRDMPVPQELVLATALRHGTSAYDAQYVALAEMLGVRCITADKPLAVKAAGVCVPLDEFVR